MSGDKSKRDIISERQFNIQGQSTHSAPDEDSPGDSDQGVGEEFLMGLNYMPGEDYELDDIGEEPGEIIFSEKREKRIAPTQSSMKGVKEAPKKKIPENVKVVSSDMPAPWKDLDTPSDTH